MFWKEEGGWLFVDYCFILEVNFKQNIVVGAESKPYGCFFRFVKNEKERGYLRRVWGICGDTRCMVDAVQKKTCATKKNLIPRGGKSLTQPG